MQHCAFSILKCIWVLLWSRDESFLLIFICLFYLVLSRWLSSLVALYKGSFSFQVTFHLLCKLSFYFFATSDHPSLNSDDDFFSLFGFPFKIPQLLWFFTLRAIFILTSALHPLSSSCTISLPRVYYSHFLLFLLAMVNLGGELANIIDIPNCKDICDA